ncbi:hypothetical protein NEUTE1DRAFT_62911 [Neurospora tetrasperma FGSC 2508]|uniref:Uncharacterized protein n=1 Tax=Neurospora tetrasperma (strain FGSC 2508 / ATCC MYA-4615 / P0657) TaxID=510951 RepID=F8MM67_NEUT8|nr:uncharacterized protein NEUTE1DRAFT_62911 [Neurospora tetrasperma FGSC 2508]EGO57741.1 hypothetical protein NEUTE1DRAFT_62911 [Neurospora tetrasperma FGSC 2508]EGZ71987.1 hypothetical protein NEUTE2DRAFT_89752 [Neurospora tetrasperma FGSC 2509]
MASISSRLSSQFVLLAHRTAPCARTASQASGTRFVLVFGSGSGSGFRTAQSARFFASKAKKAAKKPTSSSTVITTVTAPPTVVPASYAEQLAKKGRTLLYEAHSHAWFRFASFTTGSFCIAYSLYNYWSVHLNPPADLSTWVPYAYGVICAMTIGMGGYFFMGLRRIIRHIEAVPASQLLTSKPKAVPVTTPTPIYLEVAYSRAIPFLPNKKEYYHPSEVEMPFRMQLLCEKLNTLSAQKNVGKNLPTTKTGQIIAASKQKAAREKERKERMQHLLTLPFRDAAKVFRGAYDGLRRSFYREGFAKVYLRGVEYKLDMTSGWALDDGRAIDRLVHVKPSANISAY